MAAERRRPTQVTTAVVGLTAPPSASPASSSPSPRALFARLDGDAASRCEPLAITLPALLDDSHGTLLVPWAGSGKYELSFAVTDGALKLSDACVNGGRSSLCLLCLGIWSERARELADVRSSDRAAGTNGHPARSRSRCPSRSRRSRRTRPSAPPRLARGPERAGRRTRPREYTWFAPAIAPARGAKNEIGTSRTSGLAGGALPARESDSCSRRRRSAGSGDPKDYGSSQLTRKASSKSQRRMSVRVSSRRGAERYREASASAALSAYSALKTGLPASKKGIS